MSTVEQLVSAARKLSVADQQQLLSSLVTDAAVVETAAVAVVTVDAVVMAAVVSVVVVWIIRTRIFKRRRGRFPPVRIVAE